MTLAGMAATPWETEGTTASYHEALAAQPSRSQVAALLLFFGYALMGLTAAAVLHHGRRASAKLRVPAGIVAFLGATLLPGLVISDLYDLALAQSLPADQAVAIADRAQGYWSAAVFQAPAVLGLVLGSILAACVAWRSRLVGAWVPGLILVGMVLGMVSGTTAATMIAASACTLVAFAGVAVAVLRRGAPERQVAVAPVPAPVAA